MNFRFVPAFPFIFSLIFMIFNVQAAILINEVMYNPPNFLGGGTNEWIELYNTGNETLNLTGWKIFDASNHVISGFIQPYGFLILAKNLTAFYEYYNFSCNASKVGFSLNNNGEEIILKNDREEVIDNLTYSNLWGGNGDGNTIQKIDSNWLPSAPTSCEENIFHDQSGNQTNTSNTCDLQLWIECSDVFIVGSNDYRLMTEDLFGGDFDPEIEYWIEDFFGNVLKPKTKTNNTATEKSWTPPALEGTEGYKINAMITDATCNDTNISNNFAEKMIVVKGGAPISNSSISIIDVELGSDGKAKFGDNIEVKINVYKGDTSKNAIELWLENSDGKKAGKTNFNIYAKFSNYTLSVPLQISPNCNGALPNGAYFIRIEGLNGSDERQITVEGTSTSLCKTIETAKSCPSPLCPPCGQNNASEKNDEQPEDFEIVSWPDKIAKNAELVIKLRSKAYWQKNCTIYSYVYDGNKPLSLGFNGKKWLNTWNANKQEISANDSTIITLINRISNDTEPGKYKLRVKIIYDGKEHEITRDIIVNEVEANKQQKSSNEEKEKGNSTSVYDGLGDNKTAKDNVPKNEIKIPTGGIVSKKEDNWFSIAINNLMNFFKSLFKL